jgi:hypothetical protein
VNKQVGEKWSWKMESLITTIIGVTRIIPIICRTLDKWEQKKKDSSSGVSVINSLLKETKKWLDIMKNGSKNSLPKENWKGIETIPNEVMSVIPKKSKKNKSETYPLNEIREHCENYFENIIPHYKELIGSLTYAGNLREALEHKKETKETIEYSQKIQEYQKETEKIIKMLEQTKRLLEKNSKKWLFPK